MTDYKINAITPQEATERMRAVGIRISTDVIRRGLEQRVFPFGDAVQTGEQKYRYLIYEGLLEKWIAARATVDEDDW